MESDDIFERDDHALFYGSHFKTIADAAGMDTFLWMVSSYYQGVFKQSSFRRIYGFIFSGYGFFSHAKTIAYGSILP